MLASQAFHEGSRSRSLTLSSSLHGIQMHLTDGILKMSLFQVAYMEALKAKGLELYAAYGNTTTDIRAYTAAGIPKVCLPLLQVSLFYQRKA